MAGTVKKLQFSEGTDVGAPTDLNLATSTSVIEAYTNDAAYVAAEGTAVNGSVYASTSTAKFRYYLNSAWRNAVPESDASDATKTFLIDLTGNTTGVSATLLFAASANRTYTFPNVAITVAGRANSETLQNKTLDNTNTVTVSDSNFTIQDNADATKQAKFEASGISAGQTRTYTLPDASTTVVGHNATQVLTNKDFDGGTASDTSRLTIPKAAKATLDGLTRKEGTLLYASDLDKMYSDNGTTLVEVGSGSGAGGINYITNSSFEDNNVTGYALYVDAAATSPVDGTGNSGSANITFASSSSSPLRGTYNGLLTKGAANRQGEGVSYDFTIANADKSRQLCVTFEAETSSDYTGSSGTEYVSVFVYDVTNSTLLPVVGHVAPGSSKFVGYFTSTTSVSYRLIFHVAGAGTVAWTMKVDSCSVSPTSAVIGFAGSDWTSFTPTGNWSTNTTWTGRWKRIGDEMEVQFRAALAGAPDSAAFTVNLPTGYTIDTAKLLSTSTGVNGYPFGRGNAINAAVATYPISMMYQSTSSVVGVVENASGASFLYYGQNATQIIPNTFQSGDSVVGSFRVPISQWTSGVQMLENSVGPDYASNSDVSDADNAAAFVYGGAGSAFPSSAFSAARFKTVRFPTPHQPGDHFTMEVQQTSTSPWVPFVGMGLAYANGPIALEYNGGYFGAGIFPEAAAAPTTDIKVMFARYQVPGGTTNWDATSGGMKWRIKRSRGGALVGLDQMCKFKAYRTSTQSINATTEAKVQFNVEDFDTHACYDNATNYRFTPNQVGKYMVGASVFMSNMDDGNQYQLLIYKNASIVAMVESRPSSNGTSHGLCTTTLVDMNGSTDYLEVKVYNGNGGARNTGDGMSTCQFWGTRVL